ncbi:MAG: hypothetical protein H5U04_07320 [Firmicutes bacterium]|nr:hypothetical protein [Bacillota bacterium]
MKRERASPDAVWREISRLAGRSGGMAREEWLRLAARLASWDAPAPDEAAVRDFVAALKEHPVGSTAEVGFRKRLEAARAARPGGLVGLLYWLLPQVRLVGWAFWAVSAVVVALGALVTYAWAEAGVLPVVFLAPLLAALSVCYSFRFESPECREVELSCTITPGLLVWGRLAIVVGYDVLLSVGASVALLGWSDPRLVWQVVLSWMAPLLFLSCLALGISLRWGYWYSTSAVVLLWGLQVLLRRQRGWVSLLVLPGEPGWTAVQVALWAMALLAALWSAGMVRWVGRPQSG